MCAEVILKFQLLAIIHVQIKSDSAVSINIPPLSPSFPLPPPPTLGNPWAFDCHSCPGVGSLNIAWVGWGIWICGILSCDLILNMEDFQEKESTFISKFSHWRIMFTSKELNSRAKNLICLNFTEFVDPTKNYLRKKLCLN